MSRFKLTRKGRAAAPPAVFPIGMNLTERWEYAKSRQLADYFHTCDGYLGTPTLDSEGWATNANASASFKVQPEADGVALRMTWPVGRTDISNVQVANAGGTPFPIQSADYTNRTFDFTIPSGQTASGAFIISYNITGANYPRYFSIRDPNEAGQTLGTKAKTDLLQLTTSTGRIRPIKLLPSVEANNTVTTRNTLNHNWGEANFGDMPVELAVAICNELNRNLHWNFSWNASDAVITAQADYIARNLSTVCYYECSNEVWNFAYDVTNQAQTEGVAAGITVNGSWGNGPTLARLTRRHKEMMLVIDAAYTAASVSLSKRKRLLCTQHAQVDIYGPALLDYSDTLSYVDALGTACYVSQDSTGSPYSDPNGTYNVVTDVAPIIASMHDEANDVLAKGVTAKGICTARSIEYVTYEGYLAPDYSNTTLMNNLLTNAAMGTEATYFLQQWGAQVGASMCIFVYIHPVSSRGGWGLISRQGGSLTEFTKTAALKDFIAGIA